VVTASRPVEVLPLVALAPLHPPEAAHAVAFFELQVSVAAVPVPMIVGLAVSVTVGAAVVGVTVIVAVAAVLPPDPEQVSS